MNDVPAISKAPVYAADRSELRARAFYNFRDYGFEIGPAVDEVFEVVPTRVSEEECFLFFFARDDIVNNRWALFNLHVFLKRIGPVEDFARSLGASTEDINLTPATAFGLSALGYSRTISMRDLFKGAEPVIAFIGGDPDRVIRDSHYYFSHRHSHCYTGLLHSPGNESGYDSLRTDLFNLIKFLN